MKNKKKYIAISIIAILFCIGFIFLLDYIHYECPYRKFLHIYCPGCGTTRMIKSLIKLDIYQAFRYNPLMFIILIILLPIYIILNIITYLKEKKFIKITKSQLIIFVMILIIYFVLRKIKVGTFLVTTKV